MITIVNDTSFILSDDDNFDIAINKNCKNISIITDESKVSIKTDVKILKQIRDVLTDIIDHY